MTAQTSMHFHNKYMGRIGTSQYLINEYEPGKYLGKETIRRFCLDLETKSNLRW